MITANEARNLGARFDENKKFELLQKIENQIKTNASLGFLSVVINSFYSNSKLVSNMEQKVLDEIENKGFKYNRCDTKYDLRITW